MVRDKGDYPTAAPFVPATAGLDALAAAADACRGCDLYEGATQVVFGEGSAGARVLLVGEQPGDQEDRRGRPFVGPAGRLLDKALEDAGIDRADAYVTNSVKHFKFSQSAPGKRRIHSKPDAWEVAACRPWLTAEIALLSPEVVVALGATAAGTLFGPAFRVTKSRGVLLQWPPEQGPFATGAQSPADELAGARDADAPGAPDASDAPEEDAAPHAGFALATLHPSAVLRAEDREQAYAGLVADLRVAAAALA